MKLTSHTALARRPFSLLLSSTIVLLHGAQPARGETTPDCPKERIVRIDLDVWARKTRAPNEWKKFQAAMTQLGMTADPDCIESPPPPDEIVSPHVDVFKVQLTETGASANVVQVLMGICGAQMQRGAIFVPQREGPKVYCRVEAPFLNGPNWGPHCDPVVFAFEHLTSKFHSTIKVTDRNDMACGGGTATGEFGQVSWWDLRGLELVQLFSVIVSDYRGDHLHPPVVTSSATIRITGEDYPKQIEIFSKTNCYDPGEEFDVEHSQFLNCQRGPSKTHKRCRFDGRVYTCAD